MTAPLPPDGDAAAADLARWRQIRRPPAAGAPPRPCLFLDRDGVLIEEVNYIRDPDQVRLIDGAEAAIAAARARGFHVVVVTNQSGIARGRATPADHAAVEARLQALLQARGADVDAVYACPFLPGGRPPFDVDHPWRKPRPGMLQAAARDLGLDLAGSLIVGDKLSDLLAGAAAGVALGVHVATGHGAAERKAVAAHGAAQAERDGAAGPMRIVFADRLADLAGPGFPWPEPERARATRSPER